jgi:hypothetical protein
MDIFSLKPKEIVDPTAGNQKGNTALSTLANLSSAFKEMINKSGGPGDSAGAFDALARQFAGAERVEPEARPEENPYERGDLGQSNRDDHADASDDHSSNRGENRAEPADNYENNNNQSRGEERSDAAGDNRSDTGADNASDRSAGRDEQPQDTGRENASDTGKEASADGQAQAESGGQNQQQGPATSGDANNQAGNVAANSAQMNLAGVMAMAQSGGAQTNTNENAAVNAGASAQRDNAIQGLAAATANTGKDAGANQSNGQANTNVNANAQAKVNTGGEAQGQGDRPVADGRAAQQAADMASKVGNGPKATDSDATNQTGQQAAGRANQGVNPAALSHAAPQAQNGLNTAQAQQGNAQQGQIQAATSSGGDAKAMAQGPVHATAQTATSTTTESATPTTTANTNDAQQTKENQTAKEAQAQRFIPQRQAIADQVSVQINKAITAGLDRISIQLRPEALGRVDVKMDIGKDGSASIMVIAESKDTMELLQRDAKDLLRALAEAGLKADSSDLNFNLRGQQNQTANNNGDNSNSNNGGSGDGSGTGNGGSNGAEASLAAREIGDIITEDHVDVRA